MKALITPIAGLALIGTLASCSVQVDVNKQSETDMGSHHVVVMPGSTFTHSSSSSGGGGARYEYSCGDVTVQIHNEELIVNNAKYGKLKPGDNILIDHGQVFVANQERKASPMSEEEILASTPTKETTTDLAGYEVTVRPGSSFSSTTMVFGKHTLTVGRTTVAIKRDRLFVNGKSYGQLEQGDSILVEPSKVTVSGKVREAAQ